MLVRVGCILMIAAAGMRAAFTALFELDKLGLAEHWAMQWSVGYVAFIVAYALASRTRIGERERAVLLIVQSLSRALSRLAVSEFSRHGVAGGRLLADRLVDDVAQRDCGRRWRNRPCWRR